MPDSQQQSRGGDVPSMTSGLGLGPTSQGEACMSASQLQDMGAALLPKVRDIDVDNAGIIVDVLLQGWTEHMPRLLSDARSLHSAVMDVQAKLGLISVAHLGPASSTSNPKPLEAITITPAAASCQETARESKEERPSLRASMTGMLSELVTGFQGALGVDIVAPKGSTSIGVGVSPKPQGSQVCDTPVGRPVVYAPAVPGFQGQAQGSVMQAHPAGAQSEAIFSSAHGSGCAQSGQPKSGGGYSGARASSPASYASVSYVGGQQSNPKSFPFPQIPENPQPRVSPADPTQRLIGSRELPTGSVDPAFFTIAKSIEQLQELQKKALRTGSPSATIKATRNS